jgi:NAD(P)-dependent dehydrogenase (short-subunit alcohol dehydrogenase family)
LAGSTIGPYPESMKQQLSSENSLQNKVCLVTGGTRGIGRAIAEMLLAEGAMVVVCGRWPDSVTQAVSEMEALWPGKVKGKAADVSEHEDVHALFEFVDRETGGLDVLVNNAGVGTFAKVSQIGLDEWDKMIHTNLSGAFYCSREALSRFASRGAGYIVNISSLAGKNAFAGGTAYNASKFGLNGFSEALLMDTRYDNVRVSTVMPGSVATEFGRGAAGGDTGEDWKVHPEDVAGVVRTLLQMPERTIVSQVEIRPAKPKRS